MYLSKIKLNYKIILRIFIINVLILLLLLSNTIALEQNINSNSIKSSNHTFVNIPKLAWYPKSHDFGFIQEGNQYNTTFEIWNNGSGEMEWSLQIRDEWVSVNPMSGYSSGEHDIINVFINTSNLNPGSYEGNVYIHSEGDYIYYTYFSITESTLAFHPRYFNVNIINVSEDIFLNLDIWNEGEGLLNWNLHSDSNYIKISPLNGSSNKDHSNINITIKTQVLPSGIYNETINITSDGGNDYIFMNFTKNDPPSKPTIQGNSKIIKGNEVLYKIISFDPEGDNISFIVDWGDNNENNWSEFVPSGTFYNATNIWFDTGYYSIRVKAKDIHNSESNWETLEIEVPKNISFYNNFSIFKNINRILNYFPHF